MTFRKHIYKREMKFQFDGSAPMTVIVQEKLSSPWVVLQFNSLEDACKFVAWDDPDLARFKFSDKLQRQLMNFDKPTLDISLDEFDAINKKFSSKEVKVIKKYNGNLTIEQIDKHIRARLFGEKIVFNIEDVNGECILKSFRIIDRHIDNHKELRLVLQRMTREFGVTIQYFPIFRIHQQFSWESMRYMLSFFEIISDRVDNFICDFFNKLSLEILQNDYGMPCSLIRSSNPFDDLKNSIYSTKIKLDISADLPNYLSSNSKIMELINGFANITGIPDVKTESKKVELAVLSDEEELARAIQLSTDLNVENSEGATEPTPATTELEEKRTGFEMLSNAQLVSEAEARLKTIHSLIDSAIHRKVNVPGSINLESFLDRLPNISIRKEVAEHYNVLNEVDNSNDNNKDKSPSNRASIA